MLFFKTFNKESLHGPTNILIAQIMLKKPTKKNLKI